MENCCVEIYLALSTKAHKAFYGVSNRDSSEELMEQCIHGGRQAQVFASGAVFMATWLICRRNKKISSVSAVLLIFFLRVGEKQTSDTF
ncbi:hypothetical protein CDG60_05285 [Acinetobacter chinensis]|uniref:Uncharacterized protein n=1 Tax=Acinetobacter chinensis TaxID=2004650 RepID=A0A3B7LT81_9GAMM|nr:hypothetical protein CDG60_05285 [Acinetobacter chinensis]